MNTLAPKQNIKLLKMMKEAFDQERLRPSYRPVLDVRNPGRKSFILGCDLETTTGKIIPYSKLHRLARMTDTSRELDRWLIQHGLQALRELHRQQSDARLFIPQSGAALANREYPRWLERQKALADTSSQGLIVAFRLSQISRDLHQAHHCIQALHHAQVETMIEGFSDHPAALKVLRAMNSRYVSLSSALQEGEDGIIEHRMQECHRLGAKILLPDIHSAEAVNLNWAGGADLLAGDYIQPARPTLDFSFSPAVA